MATLPTTETAQHRAIQTPEPYVISLTAGQKLKIEIGPDDELDLTVPAGKQWIGVLDWHVKEFDL